MYVCHAKRHSRKHFRTCQLKQCALFFILTVCQIKMSLLAENLREFEKDNDDLWLLLLAYVQLHLTTSSFTLVLRANIIFRTSTTEVFGVYETR